uniref:Coiled-coil domain containing 142 n=1 Tax=Calidris pygmaea TaxID=425635 RepID=A0A8C3KDJ5_9CHAR
MRRALLLLALHATRLAERHVEARLRGLARTSPAASPAPALLSDLFQGLEIYNKVVGNLALELGIASRLPTGIPGFPGATGDCSHTFPVARVLEILAAERGRVAAERLEPLLMPRDGGGGAEHVCWEDATVPWLPERGTTAADAGPSGQEEPPGLTVELQALCREDQELMGLVLGALVASADSLWHHILHGPKQEKPPAAESPESLEPPAASLGTATRPSSAGWKSVRWLDASRAPAAEALHAQYRPLFWGATSTVLGHRLGLPHCRAGGAMATARELGCALAQGRLGGPVRSRTARCLQRLYPALAFALRCLRPLPACLPGEWGPRGRGTSTLGVPSGLTPARWVLLPSLVPVTPLIPLPPPGRPPGSPCLRLQVLGCCLATAQAACSWLMGRAFRYLAAWALPQFLLVTQGDLQVQSGQGMGTDLWVWALPQGVSPLPAEAGLCKVLWPPCATPNSPCSAPQLFSGDVLKMFSTDCKRMSAEIFDQTMPLGKHWRVGLRADLPSSPSEYAAAAAQAVLGQVLQGAQLLPRDAQAPALARVTTAFLEAWMDHILAQRIKFSLQGALQLRQDFELVRELVGSERYGLAPETRQSLLSLRVFQQMDGAILCLLQQPGGAASVHWAGAGGTTGVATLGCPMGSDHLRTLADSSTGGGGPQGGGKSRLSGGVPESYLSGSQQQWLSLRLHRARRWRVPGLPCVGNTPET